MGTGTISDRKIVNRIGGIPIFDDVEYAIFKNVEDTVAGNSRGQMTRLSIKMRVDLGEDRNKVLADYGY